jgi:hypothetical protein
MVTDNGASSEDDPLLNPRPLHLPDASRDQATKTVFWGLLVMAFISMSYSFIEAPLYRLYETNLCKRYYREHNPLVIGLDAEIPEEKCKLDSIQQDLAILLTKQVQINLWACKYSEAYLRSIFAEPYSSSG